jgi:hypothetical protein
MPRSAESDHGSTQFLVLCHRPLMNRDDSRERPRRSEASSDHARFRISVASPSGVKELAEAAP